MNSTISSTAPAAAFPLIDPLLAPPKSKKVNIIVRIWKVVCRFFKGLFLLLGFGKKPSPRLSPEEIRVLNAVQKLPPPPPRTNPESALRNRLSRANTSSSTLNSSGSHFNVDGTLNCQISTFEDPSLTRFCEISNEVVPKVVDVITDTLKPKVEDIQRKAKGVLEVVGNVLTKAQSIPRVIENYQPLIKSGLKSLLDFLVEKPSKRRDMFEMDFSGKKIISMFLHKSINLRQKIGNLLANNAEFSEHGNHRELILAQFFDNNSGSLSLNREEYNPVLLDSIFEKTLELCIDENINTYLNLANNVFFEKLPKILNLLKKISNNDLTTPNTILKQAIIVYGDFIPLATKYLTHVGHQGIKDNLRIELTKKIRSAYNLKFENSNSNERKTITIPENLIDNSIDRFLFRLENDFKKSNITNINHSYNLDEVHAFLVTNLEVKETLVDSMNVFMTITGSNASQLLSGRIATLIEKIKFPDTIDNLAQILLVQVREEMKATVSANQIIEKLKVQNKRNAEENGYYAKEILRVGKENFRKRLVAKQFSDQPHCHSVLREGYSRTDKTAHEIEVEYYAKKVDQIEALLFPNSTAPNSNGPAVDGMTQFCKEIIDFNEIPQELLSLFKEMISLSQQVLFALPSNEISPSPFNIEELLVSIVKPKIKDMLSEKIHHLFQNLTSPESITQNFAKTIFPAVKEPLMKAFISHEIVKHFKKINDNFYRITYNEVDADIARSSIITNLLQYIKEDFIDFKLSDAPDGISEKRLKEIIEQVVDTAQLHLSRVKDEYKNRGAILKQKKHDEYLLSYLSSENTDTNVGTYGRLTRLLFFKIGGLKIFENGFFNFITKTALNNERVRKIIDEAICQALNPIRTSHHFMVNSLIQGLQNIFDDPSKFKALVFSSPDASDTKVPNFEESIKPFARLAHDLVEQTIKYNVHVKAFSLSPQTNEIVRVVKLCFKRLFDNHDINRNLVFSSLDFILNILGDANQQIAQSSMDGRSTNILPPNDDDIAFEIQ